MGPVFTVCTCLFLTIHGCISWPLPSNVSGSDRCVTRQHIQLSIIHKLQFQRFDSSSTTYKVCTSPDSLAIPPPPPIPLYSPPSTMATKAAAMSPDITANQVESRILNGTLVDFGPGADVLYISIPPTTVRFIFRARCHSETLSI